MRNQKSDPQALHPQPLWGATSKYAWRGENKVMQQYEIQEIVAQIKTSGEWGSSPTITEVVES